MIPMKHRRHGAELRKALELKGFFHRFVTPGYLHSGATLNNFVSTCDEIPARINRFNLKQFPAGIASPLWRTYFGCAVRHNGELPNSNRHFGDLIGIAATSCPSCRSLGRWSLLPIPGAGGTRTPITYGCL
jgi:hypothetical protein